MKKLWWSALPVVVGAAAFAAEPAPVQMIRAARVTAAFEKGEPLVETPAYKVHASRRDRDGMAELHVTDTDIVYVLSGTATLITGGRIVDGRTTAAQEVRGASIAGGETRQVAKGDVVIVPNGVPHQFLHVTVPFTYYVVKVTDATGGAR